MPNRNLTAALLAASLLAFVLDSPQPVTAQDTEIRVLCSNGFGAAMHKLLPQAERAAGRKVKLQLGSSASFKTSIEGGEPFDLAILTPQIIDDLINAGKIAAETKVDLATSGIGVAVRAGQPKPDVTTADAIKKTLQAAKSVGYVPVGASTPPLIAMLTSLGIKQEVQRKAALQPGAEQSMKSVADGEVEVAFGLISEIVPAPGVQLAGPLPPEFQKRIGLAAGIASSTKNREAANKFIKSLTTAAAAPALKATGLDPIAKEK
jgi:molybdate transport system substrate-binding protein